MMIFYFSHYHIVSAIRNGTEMIRCNTTNVEVESAFIAEYNFYYLTQKCDYYTQNSHPQRNSCEHVA